MPAGDHARGKTQYRARKSVQGDLRQKNQLIRTLPTRTWEEVEHAVDHISDFEAHIQQFQVTQNGAILTMQIPLSYAQHILTVQQVPVPMMFFRVFTPPLPPSFVLETDDMELGLDG